VANSELAGCGLGAAAISAHHSDSPGLVGPATGRTGRSASGAAQTEASVQQAEQRSAADTRACPAIGSGKFEGKQQHAATGPFVGCNACLTITAHL